MDWIEFWRAKLPGYSPQPTHCCLFSRSLIYTRTLMELLRTTTTRVMVMESFFTGNDYYFEEKYEPVPNNTDLRFDVVYNALTVPDAPMEYDRERMKAINKFILMKNKNVEQPAVSRKLPFTGERPVVVVLGQVVNDFSVLGYKSRGLSTIAFYREVIEQLVKVGGCDVVFKDHPWELRKTHVKRPFTRELLEEWLATQPAEVAAHVVIDTEFDIRKLFKQCDFAVGLNTQSLIEAAFEGLKPVQFGNAFYGRRGFTHDYDLTQVPQFIEDLTQGRIQGGLTLPEFDAFELFLVKALQQHLVSVNPSGVAALAQKLAAPNTIALAKPSTGAPTAPAAPAVPKAPSPPPATAPIVPPVRGHGVPAVVDTPELQAALASPDNKTVLQKKVRKFFRDPFSFFFDARLFRKS
jgi:hypothetical protein